MTFNSKDDEPAEEFDEILLEFLRKHDSGQPIDREAFFAPVSRASREARDFARSSRLDRANGRSDPGGFKS